MQDLARVPDLVGRCLDREEEVIQVAKELKDTRNALYLGRGINMPIAYEGALKLKEISYIHAEGYPAGEMKHGPIALVDRDMPVIAIAPRDPWYEKMISQVEQAKARGGSVVVVATEGDERVPPLADHVFWVPEAPWMLSPVVTVIPLQLLAYHIAAAAGAGRGPAEEPGEERDGGVEGDEGFYLRVSHSFQGTVATRVKPPAPSGRKMAASPSAIEIWAAALILKPWPARMVLVPGSGGAASRRRSPFIRVSRSVSFADVSRFSSTGSVSALPKASRTVSSARQKGLESTWPTGMSNCWKACPISRACACPAVERLRCVVQSSSTTGFEFVGGGIGCGVSEVDDVAAAAQRLN